MAAKLNIITTFILVIVLLPCTVKAAHFVCGEVHNADDGTDAGWRNIRLHYPEDEMNFVQCMISPETRRFCCDAEAIPNYSWSIGANLSASVVDDIDGYLSDIGTVLTTGEGFDTVHPLQLQYALESDIINKTNFLDSPQLIINITSVYPYTNNITYSLNNNAPTTLCTSCNRTNITFEGLSQGRYDLSISASSTNMTRSISRRFYMDMSAPLTPLLVWPFDNSIIPSTRVDFRYIAYDDYIDDLICTVKVDEKEYPGIVSPNGTEITYSLSDFQNGIHSWQVQCSDSSGLSNISNLTTFEVAKHSDHYSGSDLYNRTINWTNDSEEPFVNNVSDTSETEYRFLTDKPIFFYPDQQGSSLKNIIVWVDNTSKPFYLSSYYSTAIPENIQIPEILNLYQVVEILTNLPSEHIREMLISFSVDKGWADSHGLANLKIAWYNYTSGKLQTVGSMLKAVDDKSYTYEILDNRFGTYLIYATAQNAQTISIPSVEDPNYKQSGNMLLPSIGIIALAIMVIGMVQFARTKRN
jgi:hypothetical protein